MYGHAAVITDAARWRGVTWGQRGEASADDQCGWRWMISERCQASGAAYAIRRRCHSKIQYCMSRRLESHRQPCKDQQDRCKSRCHHCFQCRNRTSLKHHTHCHSRCRSCSCTSLQSHHLAYSHCRRLDRCNCQSHHWCRCRCRNRTCCLARRPFRPRRCVLCNSTSSGSHHHPFFHWDRWYRRTGPKIGQTYRSGRRLASRLPTSVRHD